MPQNTYVRTVWVNDSEPPLSADNLNKIEQGVVDAHIHMSTKNNPHSVTAEQIGAATEADLNAHIDDKNNPHSVTAEQIGAATEADLNAHIDDKNNPHSVTAEQIGAATEADLNAHIDDKNNPHSVTAEQIGAATEMDLITHIADSGNPHQVTAEQVGSPTMTEFVHHTDDKANPHQVTAEQVGSPTMTEFTHHTDDKANPHEVTHDQTNPEGVDLTDDDVERNKHISNDDGKRWNDHVNHPHPHSNHETPAGAQAKVNAHAERTDNPHNVTAVQIGAVDIAVLTAHEENATLHLTPELRAALDYSEYPPTGENPVVTTIELHNAMAGSTKSAVGTAAELSAIPPTQRRDRDMRLVEEEGKIYRFDAEAIEGDIPPDEGSGYWIAVASATQSHNNLSGMQGGDANLVQYYHLSHDEYIAVTTHHERLDNPHEVTAAQVGAVAAINGITALGGHLSIWQQGEDLETVNNPETGTILLVNNHNGQKDNPHEVTHDQVDPVPVEYGSDETRDKHLSNYDFAVLIDHLYSPVAHESTPENMEGKIVRRDAEGRAKVSEPEDDDDIATKGYVDQSLSSFSGVPSGLIAMWSGAIANIPSGWALCDGSNGTPDLRDRFIVGAGKSYNVGDTGGANSVTLNINQMPSHDHGSGSLSASTAGSHSHSYRSPAYPGSVGSGSDHTPYQGATTEDTGSAGSHSHIITGTTSSRGGGQAHENRPPYYALAYIMKL